MNRPSNLANKKYLKLLEVLVEIERVVNAANAAKLEWEDCTYNPLDPSEKNASLHRATLDLTKVLANYRSTNKTS